MSSLQCPTCKKVFTRNYNLERHLARKFPCKPAEVVESQRITKYHKESQCAFGK